METEGVHLEDERRINLRSLPSSLIDGSLITQGFLAKSDTADVRIRKREYDGEDPEYSLTVKFRPEHQESEMEISPEMFKSLFPTTQSKQQKMRYQQDGWDVDQFADGHIVAEYEFDKSEDKVEIPGDWDVEGQIEELVKNAFWIRKG